MRPYQVELWQVIVTSYIRYFVLAGGAYLVFYAWKRRDWFHFKIQQVFPKRAKVQQEVIFSLLTLLIFGAVVHVLLFTPIRNNTQLYIDWSKYSTVYNWLSLPLVIILHDSYFYWMHRFMHMPTIFKWVHRVHHESRNPTPLAAFSFHPLEALLEISFLPLLLVLLPVHWLVLGLFGLWMIVMNVWGHLGYEFLPIRFMKSRLGWLNTSTGHNMHHQHGWGNYGLYFNFWDKWMSTNHPEYKKRFSQITDRAQRTQAIRSRSKSKRAVDRKNAVVH